MNEARHAYDRAIGLAEDPAVREFLLEKRADFFSLGL
jgi:predicted RNA polymerase sigma factor